MRQGHRVPDRGDHHRPFRVAEAGSLLDLVSCFALPPMLVADIRERDRLRPALAALPLGVPGSQADPHG